MKCMDEVRSSMRGSVLVCGEQCSVCGEQCSVCGEV